MNSGYMLLLVPGPKGASAVRRAAIELITFADLSLKSPLTGGVDLVGDDGEFFVVGTGEFEARLAEEPQTLFTAWSRTKADLPVDIVNSDTTATLFVNNLLNLWDEELDVLIHAAMALWRRMAKHTEAFVFVYDETSDSDNCDWVGFAEGRAGVSGPAPNLLVVPTSRVTELGAFPPPERVNRVGQVTALLYRNDLMGLICGSQAPH